MAQRSGPLILGHRGARQRAAENTLEAFELAVREGADGVELDVRLDRSGNVVVLHDPTLERVTAGVDLRSVEQLPSAELDQVRLPGGERIPRLEQVLRWAAAAGVMVNVELKPDGSRRDRLVRRVAGILRRCPLPPPKLLLSSLHPGILARLARWADAYSLGWVIAPELEWFWREPLWPGLPGVAAHPHRSLVTAGRLAAVHRRRARLNVWTVNDPNEAVELARLGVDAIITDDPAGMVAALR